MSNQVGKRAPKVAVLSCLHTLIFSETTPPRAGEIVWCPKCGHYRTAAVPPDSFRVDCRECSRRGEKDDYAGNRLQAEIAADRHARKRRGHRVRVWNGSALHSERMLEPEPSLLDAPPF